MLVLVFHSILVVHPQAAVHDLPHGTAVQSRLWTDGPLISAGDPFADSHGMAGVWGYVWSADQAGNNVEIIDTVSNLSVGSIDLVTDTNKDPAPDLLGNAPDGQYVFVGLRGPNPLTGNDKVVHNAKGTISGIGVIHVDGGWKVGHYKGSGGHHQYEGRKRNGGYPRDRRAEVISRLGNSVGPRRGLPRPATRVDEMLLAMRTSPRRRGADRSAAVSVYLVLTVLCLTLGACAGLDSGDDLPTVPSVDLSRYAGTWYEIARLPIWFQRHCVDSKAIYSRRPDGAVGVHNECVTQSGVVEQAEGVATVVDAKTNARLTVIFDNWFAQLFGSSRDGNYWILDLDPEYRTAMVGTPDRRFLWILSRTSQLDETTYRRLVERCRQLGYPMSDLIRARRPASS